MCLIHTVIPYNFRRRQNTQQSMICLGIKICKMASDLVKKSVDHIFEAKIWLHCSAHFSVFGLLLNKKNVIMSLSCVAVITHFPVVLVISHYREKSLQCKYISLPLRRKNSGQEAQIFCLFPRPEVLVRLGYVYRYSLANVISYNVVSLRGNF